MPKAAKQTTVDIRPLGMVPDGHPIVAADGTVYEAKDCRWAIDPKHLAEFVKQGFKAIEE